MPTWTAPFHLPKFTSEEFQKMKANYQAKYGATIHVPGFEDIIHLWQPAPITPAEEILWKKKDYGRLGPKRYLELKEMKQKRKEAFLRMLASPTTPSGMNMASVLTAIDDTQDALSTLVTIGKVASRWLPRVLGRFVSGPVGWTMAAGDILNMIQTVGRTPMLPKATKRLMSDQGDLNPLTKKAKVRRAKRIKRWKPSSGALLEVAQVTDQVFGVGISLGPIVGFATDLVFGALKNLQGKPVKMKLAPSTTKPWEDIAYRYLKTNYTHNTVSQFTDETEETRMYIAQNLASQVVSAHAAENSPFDCLEDPNDVIVHAPWPTNVLTVECFEEEGLDYRDYIGWPALGKKWATYEELRRGTERTATDNLQRYCQRNKHNWMGFVGANNAVESTFYGLENLEGQGNVDYDYTVASKTMITLLDHGYIINPNATQTQISQFAAILEYYDRIGQTFSLKSILSTARDSISADFIIKKR